MENLADIAVFVKVVEKGSFTKAADELELSKAVVSKYLTRLEARLGARLLHRTTRRLALTEAGSALFEQSRLALERIDEAQAALARFQSAPRGRLMVSAPMAFGVLRLGCVLPDFLAKHPGVTLDIRLEDRFVNLVAEGFDLAVRIGRLTDSSLVARKLAPSRQVIVASPDYVRRYGAPQSPEDLASHNCFVYTLSPGGNVWRFDRAGEEMRVPVTGNLRLNSGLLEREAAERGAGIALLPTFYVAEQVAAGKLAVLLPDWKLPELGIYAVYPQSPHVPPKVRAFVDYLVGHFGPKPAWDRLAPAATVSPAASSPASPARRKAARPTRPR